MRSIAAGSRILLISPISARCLGTDWFGAASTVISPHRSKPRWKFGTTGEVLAARARLQGSSKAP